MILSDIYKMGHVLNQGLLRMAQTWNCGGTTFIRYANEIFHYFGDPSMEMYTASPTKFTNATVSQSGTTFTVNTGGISGCTIAITSMDYGVSYFDVRHNVSSATFTNVTASCYVTITKHNYIPYSECSTPTFNFINQIVTTNTTITGCGDINVQNVKVQNGAKLILDAAGVVNIISDFEVVLGSEFEIK